MSMIANFRLARRQDVQRLLEEPERIASFLDGGDEEGLEVPDGAPEPGGTLDIDKAWHGLHFLFTGTAWEGRAPLNFIVSGGRPVGEVDVGYGPARAFMPEELAAIAAALGGLGAEELRRRFDPKRMKKLDIYPDIWGRPPEEDDALGYLLEYFETLKAFLQKGAAEGLGLLVYLN